jgi:hypothetical protein
MAYLRSEDEMSGSFSSESSRGMRCTFKVQAFIETRNQPILAVSRASGKGIGNGKRSSVKQGSEQFTPWQMVFEETCRTS